MKIFLGVTLALGIALALLWRASVDQTLELVSTTPGENYVDLYMKNFKLTGMNTEGEPSYTLTANRLEHFNKSNITLIDKPEFRFIENKSIWAITSNEGQVDTDNNRVYLKENVRMVQLDSNNPIQLETDNLTINTKTQIARSKDKVTIQQNNLKLTALGMIFNNRTGQLKLLSNVDGTYSETN